MKRDPAAVAGQEFDVLVVGGGIHGAAIARECSCRGMSTLLVEKKDFGHATSANSLKILHGGLRYLQHFNIKRMRDSILARREMMRLAPQCVKPLGCIIPNVGNGLRGNFFMRLALMVNDLIGSDRNAGIASDHHLPPGKVLSLEECRKLLPGVEVDDLKGASLWYDALAVNSERLTLSFVHQAAAFGARVLNYTSMSEVLFEDGRVVGGLLKDELDGRKIQVQARCVVNAAGPWGNNASQGKKGGAERPGAWAKAVNIIVKKSFFAPYAVGLSGEEKYEDKDAVVRKKGRFFFFVPWRGYTMIGTTYKPCCDAPDRVRAEALDIEELIQEVNTMYPSADLTFQDVTNAHAGLVPMSSAGSMSDSIVQLEKESECIDHGASDAAKMGLYSIKGVKYTTAPRVAKETADIAGEYLGRVFGSFLPESTRQGCRNDQEEVAGNIPEEYDFLEKRYGDMAGSVYGYIRKADGTVCRSSRVYTGEIDYFLQEEMAQTLADIVFRRSDLATAECPDMEVLKSISKHMGDFLGWDTHRRDQEVENVVEHFAPLLQTGRDAVPGSSVNSDKES